MPAQSNGMSNSQIRSFSLAVVGISLVAVVATIGWNNRNKIDALLTNHINEPSASETSPVKPIDSRNPPLLRLAVAGDVGTGGSAAYKTADSIDVLDEQYPFDALLVPGDIVYEDGDPDQVDEKFFIPFKSVLDNDTELIAVLGNHDVESGQGDALEDALGMPNSWYATTLEDVLIVALDSNQPKNEEQLTWLDDTLAGSGAKWTIAMFHHPPYSGGWHGGNKAVKENFVPLFEKHKVELVLSGHEHDYQRTSPINSTTYLISGAGAKLRATGTSYFTETAWGTHHFVDFSVYPDRIEGQAIDHDGRSIDSFVLKPN